MGPQNILLDNSMAGTQAAGREAGAERLQPLDGCRRCLEDTQPRQLTVEDYRVLNNCAEMVVRRLEAEQFSLEHAGAAAQVGRRPSCLCLC